MTQDQALQDAWVQLWPHYCRTCEGSGVICWEEQHDRGYPGELMSEPCRCIDNNQCPRCGKSGIIDASDEPPFTCPHCKWDSNNPDFLPQVPESFIDEDPEEDTY